MKTIHSVSRLAAISALSAVGILACGGAPKSNEATSSTSQAVDMSSSFTASPFDVGQIGTFLGVAQIPSIGLVDGAIQVEPSPPMAQFGIKTINQSITTSMPFDVTLLGVTIDGTVLLTDLSVAPTSIVTHFAPDSNGIDVSATFNGTAHVTLSVFSGDVSFDGTVATEIGRAPVSGSDALQVNSLALTISNPTASCGAGDWCGPIMQLFVNQYQGSALGSVYSDVNTALKKAIASPSVATSVDAALSFYTNFNLGAGAGGTPWVVVPGTLQFNTFGANFDATHWVAPAPLTGCDATESCDVNDALEVYGYCDSDKSPGSPGNDSQQLERLIAGTWTAVGAVDYDNDPSPPIPATLKYRIHAWSPAGDTYSSEFDFTTFSASCASGGGGGQPPGGGGGGLPGGGGCPVGGCKSQ